MKNVLLHSDISFLFMEMRKFFEVKMPPTADNLLKSAMELIRSKSGVNEEVCLLIPAFDYRAFSQPDQLELKTKTKFGLARKLLEEDANYEIIWDPIFRFARQDHSSLRIEREKIQPKLSYSPFTKPNQILHDDDYIVFTANSFQPTLLIEMEYSYFKDNHPYRRIKKFHFTDKDLQYEIDYEYLVRPLSHEAVYNLVNLKQDLIKNKLLKPIGNSTLLIMQFGNVKDFLHAKFKSDPFYLLDKDKSTPLIQIHEERRMFDLVY